MEKYFLAGIILIVLLLTTSCGNTNAYLNVVEGNYAFSRGEYQDANFNYLNVKEKEIFDDYISYNLGNVYYALGEINSAFKEWESTGNEGYQDVNIRKLYNTGVLLYELSRFEEAYRVFRNVLEIDPSNVSAKINLEYCIQKMSFTAENRITTSKNAGSDNSHDAEDVSRILNFVKRKETNIWKSSSKAQTETGLEEDW
ncbi:MAG: tetratricopeptide repeat protein [Spirochaetales bacterium]|nr:tetratricopeptide repeat protein [Spirochaetales bacterium]